MLEAFLGALVGSVSAMAAQWYLAPRIERRVRAQERWELFLIEFASLIDGPVKRAHDEARRDWFLWRSEYSTTALYETREEFRKLTTRRRLAFYSAVSEWRESLVRPEWLAKRVMGDLRSAGQDLQLFYRRWVLYKLGATDWDTDSDPPGDDPSQWDRLSEHYTALVEAVDALSSRIGEPIGTMQLFRTRRRRASSPRTSDDPESATIEASEKIMLDAMRQAQKEYEQEVIRHLDL